MCDFFSVCLSHSLFNYLSLSLGLCLALSLTLFEFFNLIFVFFSSNNQTCWRTRSFRGKRLCDQSEDWEARTCLSRWLGLERCKFWDSGTLELDRLTGRQRDRYKGIKMEGKSDKGEAKGWTKVDMDRSRDRQTYRQRDGHTERWTYWEMDIQRDGHTERCTKKKYRDGGNERLRNEITDRQIYRQKKIWRNLVDR